MQRGSPPELSVIVLAVGAPAELRKAVESLLRQSTPVEVIVVNSGGGDVRSALPRRGKGMKIVSVDHLLWPGAARNKGIEAASAPFIAFLAADCVAEADWAARRLARHREGAMAVSSSVVSSRTGNLFATASHAFLYAARLPGLPETQALRYGASYSRRVFKKYGLFREDLRVGEDTEFLRRCKPPDRPVWAPEVRTVHRSPATFRAMMADKYQRGKIRGTHLQFVRKGLLKRMVVHRFQTVARCSLASCDSQSERLWALASLPLVGLCVGAHMLGVLKGRLLREGGDL